MAARPRFAVTPDKTTRSSQLLADFQPDFQESH
jgi:hypothetical protein